MTDQSATWYIRAPQETGTWVCQICHWLTSGAHTSHLRTSELCVSDIFQPDQTVLLTQAIQRHQDHHHIAFQLSPDARYIPGIWRLDLLLAEISTQTQFNGLFHSSFDTSNSFDALTTLRTQKNHWSLQKTTKCLSKIATTF